MIEVPTQRLRETAILPTKDRLSDVGFDLYADETVIISPVPTIGGLPTKVKTGIAMAIPEGYGGFIWDRSGLSTKNGLHRVAGVIDPQYRGEILVAVYNLSDKSYTINRGDRIAQIVIQEVPYISLIDQKELPTSDRGKDGFGSSGK